MTKRARRKPGSRAAQPKWIHELVENIVREWGVAGPYAAAEKTPDAQGTRDELQGGRQNSRHREEPQHTPADMLRKLRSG